MYSITVVQLHTICLWEMSIEAAAVYIFLILTKSVQVDDYTCMISYAIGHFHKQISHWHTRVYIFHDYTKYEWVPMLGRSPKHRDWGIDLQYMNQAYVSCPAVYMACLSSWNNSRMKSLCKNVTFKFSHYVSSSHDLSNAAIAQTDCQVRFHSSFCFVNNFRVLLFLW